MSFLEVIGFGLTMVAYHLGVIAILMIPIAVFDPQAFARPYRTRQRAVRKRNGWCVECGYDLRGSRERSLCPECGELIERAEPTSANRSHG